MMPAAALLDLHLPFTLRDLNRQLSANINIRPSDEGPVDSSHTRRYRSAGKRSDTAFAAPQDNFPAVISLQAACLVWLAISYA